MPVSYTHLFVRSRFEFDFFSLRFTHGRPPSLRFTPQALSLIHISALSAYLFEYHVFPVPSNGSCNKILKEIGRQCGFKVRLTYHVARHTNATTVLLSHGVPIETVSRLLGHTNIKTTQIYAKITDVYKRQMQGGVLPFQRLDLVTAEKRTDTLGDVGGCDGCRPFQFLGRCV